VIFSLAAITTKIINDYTKAWEQILAQEQVTQGEL
jgi:hypothetical protein